MEYKLNRVSPTYVMTLDMHSEKDREALADIRKRINANRASIRRSMKYAQAAGLTNIQMQMPRVKVFYRRPKIRLANGRLYPFGGTVRVAQMPSEADVYIINERV